MLTAHLVQALNRLVDWDRGLTFTPDTEAYIARLTEALSRRQGLLRVLRNSGWLMG